MTKSLFATVAVLAASSSISIAAGPSVASSPLAAGRTAVVAKKPSVHSARATASPVAPALLFARRDVARMQQWVDQLGRQIKETKNIAEKTALIKKRVAETVRLQRARQRLEALSRIKNLQPDPKATRLLETFTLSRPAISCRFDPAGRYLFAGSQDSVLHRFDLATRQQTDLTGHESWIRRFALQKEGSLLVSGSYAGRLIWWNPAEAVPKPLRVVEAHKGYVRGVAISPDGRWVASGGNDAMVRIWSAADGRLIRELPGHERHVYNVRFDPSGKFLVSGDLMGVLKQWEVGTWKHVRDLDAKVLSKYDKTFRADCGGIRGMDFSPDGRFLAVCGITDVTNAFAGVGTPAVVLFDFATGKRLRVMKPAKSYRGACWGVVWHPSGKFLIGSGGNNNGMLWFWKPGADKSFHAVKVPGNAYDVCVHPDGLRLAVAMYNRTVAVYDLAPPPSVPPSAGKKSAGKKSQGKNKTGKKRKKKK